MRAGSSEGQEGWKFEIGERKGKRKGFGCEGRDAEGQDRGKDNVEDREVEGEEAAISRRQIGYFICNVHILGICSRVPFFCFSMSAIFLHTQVRFISYILGLLFPSTIKTFILIIWRHPFYISFFPCLAKM